MENPEISGRIQVERFIPVGFFRKKSNIFRGITFFPFIPKRAKFSVPFVWITSPRLHVERKWKIYRYFVNGTTQSCSCFRCQILTNQINNQSIIPSTDVIQLTLTLKMTTAQVVETSVTVNNNSPIQDYVHPDNQTQPFEMTPGFKPFTAFN